jgi:hypothetical protein
MRLFNCLLYPGGSATASAARRNLTWAHGVQIYPPTPTPDAVAYKKVLRDTRTCYDSINLPGRFGSGLADTSPGRACIASHTSQTL